MRLRYRPGRIWRRGEPAILDWRALVRTTVGNRPMDADKRYSIGADIAAIWRERVSGQVCGIVLPYKTNGELEDVRGQGSRRIAGWLFDFRRLYRDRDG
jgi:hypothetical protein